MKKIPFAIALLSTLCVSTTWARGPAAQPGLSGDIALNLFYFQSESNLSTDSDATQSSLSQSAPSEQNVIIAPLGNLRYTFGQRQHQQLYLGTTREDIAVGTVAFQLGYRHTFTNGIIGDFSVLPTILSGEVWQDPYLLNAARQTTDEDGMAYRIKLERLFGVLGLDMAYAQSDVEQDALANTALARDADLYAIKAYTRVPLGRGSFLVPSVRYLNHDADGAAASFDEYRAQLSWFQMFNAHRFGLTVDYAVQEYQAINPLFGKTRENQISSLFAVYEYQKPLGWRNWSLVGLAGYENNDANITYYDQTQAMVSLGMNYKF